jgi:hypothetical protein
MSRRITGGLVLSMVALIAVGIAAGFAYATAGSGTFGACAQTQTGQLRLDTGSGCLASERPVQLGTAAASRADERFYVAPNLSDFATYLPLTIGTFPAVLANPTRVVTMHVPAGDYAVASQITFVNHTGDVTVPCLLLDSAGQIHGYDETSVGIDAGFNRNETMTMDGALSLTADTDMSLACWANPIGGFDPGATLVRSADVMTKTVDHASITQEVH